MLTKQSAPIVGQQQGLHAVARWRDGFIRRIRLYGWVFLIDVVCVSVIIDGLGVVQLLFIVPPVNVLIAYVPVSLLAGCIYAMTAYLMGMHRRLWRYANPQDLIALVRTVILAFIVIGALDVIAARPALLLPLSILSTGMLVTFIVMAFLKLLPRLVSGWHSPFSRRHAIRVLIAGAGQAGANLANYLLREREPFYRIIGFVDDDPNKLHHQLYDVPIIGTMETIPHIVERDGIDLVVIALPSAGSKRISEIIALCQTTNARIVIIPNYNATFAPQAQATLMREINIADLLGRPEIVLPAAEGRAAMKDQIVLVTGAAGSIGSELCRQLVQCEPRLIIALDNNETGLFDLAEGLHGHPYAERLRLRIGDITDEAMMLRLFQEENPRIIFHAAAYKHVPLLEGQPEQAIHTNVVGTLILARLARMFDARRFIFISTDKAVDPVGILGASKRLGELIISAMEAERTEDETHFCAVRFGNVIGSRGSVIPSFTKQIAAGGPVTVTHPEVTRYFMTISEACGLVILTTSLDERQGLYVLDMGQPVAIADLAVKLIRLQGLRIDQDIKIEFTRLRPGERLHESLTSVDETLLPTAQDKILKVLGRASPPFSELEYDILVLQRALLDADTDLLRHRLMRIVRQPLPARPLLRAEEIGDGIAN